MSREIKFRAWDKENNVMLSNQDLDNYDKDGVMHLYDILKDQEKEGVELMQYTGLKDKNGKEIYEGDVNQYGYVIKFCEEKGLFGEYGTRNGIDYDILMSYPIDSKSQNIKGNIHENPELIK